MIRTLQGKEVVPVLSLGTTALESELMGALRNITWVVFCHSAVSENFHVMMADSNSRHPECSRIQDRHATH